MRIVIETIDHELQRYPTCGDWKVYNYSLQINVSNVDDWRMEALVGIHELVEAVLCIDKGISQESVDKFDIAFEKAREHAIGGIEEPGDSPEAPYHIQHGYATAVERMLCAAMNIPWATYESRLKELDG